MSSSLLINSAVGVIARPSLAVSFKLDGIAAPILCIESITSSGDITLLDKDYKDVDKNKIGCTLANISLCEYLKLKDLMNLLNNTYKDFDLDYFLQKCKQYQFLMRERK